MLIFKYCSQLSTATTTTRRRDPDSYYMHLQRSRCSPSLVGHLEAGELTIVPAPTQLLERYSSLSDPAPMTRVCLTIPRGLRPWKSEPLRSFPCPLGRWLAPLLASSISFIAFCFWALMQNEWLHDSLLLCVPLGFDLQFHHQSWAI